MTGEREMPILGRIWLLISALLEVSLPKPQPPKNKRSSERQHKLDRVLDAAQLLFGRQGYQQATMEEIAHEGGLSVGTLYNMFEDKECLYAHVALRIGQRVLERLRPLADYEHPEVAIHDLIRLLLHNYQHDRLFFQPFSLPSYLKIQPEPDRLGPEVRSLYQEYVALVETLFNRCRTEGSGKREKNAVKMASYIDGIVTAVIGCCSGPLKSPQSAKVARQITDMLLRGVGFPVDASSEPGEAVSPETRASYITRYDLERLQELIEVVRTLGRDEWLAHAEALEAVLARARITNPREVPPDVITMNSKAEIQNFSLGKVQVVTLVFPKDADESTGNISILTPVGMAMFGRRVGDTFSVVQDGRESKFRVFQILYQPEAAGDFSL